MYIKDLKSLQDEIQSMMLALEEKQKIHMKETGRRYIDGGGLTNSTKAWGGGPAAGTKESRQRFTGHRTGRERT